MDRYQSSADAALTSYDFDAGDIYIGIYVYVRFSHVVLVVCVFISEEKNRLLALSKQVNRK